MTATKTRNAWGFMGKVETTYGTPIALAAGSDGILLADFPTPDFGQYLHDGSRGRTPGGPTRVRVKQSGRFGNIKAPAEAIGGGAAYSASVFSSLHTLLRTGGLDPVGSFGAGVEKWTFTPETGPTGLDAATFQAYVEGQMYQLYGAYSSFEITADGPGVPIWDFDLQGLADVETDAAIPTITSYPAATLLPPKAESIALTLGLFTAGVVRSFHFDAGREHGQARADLNSGGHKGFTPGGRNPTLTVVVERVALATVGPWHTASTINPKQLKETGTQIICSLAVGSVQYNRWKLFAGSPASAAQAQVVEVKDGEDGPAATWEITLEFKPSTLTANDEYAIVFD